MPLFFGVSRRTYADTLFAAVISFRRYDTPLMLCRHVFAMILVSPIDTI